MRRPQEGEGWSWGRNLLVRDILNDIWTVTGCDMVNPLLVFSLGLKRYAPMPSPTPCQDGSPCGMPVNRAECEFCIYHAQSALRRLSLNGGRPELQAGGRSYTTKALAQVAKRGERI